MSCTDKPQGLFVYTVLLAFLTPSFMIKQFMFLIGLFLLLIDRCGGQFCGETETPAGDSQ